MNERQFNDPESALAYILAGRATFTVISRKTGVRFTYRVKLAPTGSDPARNRPWFVSVLTGPENESAYTYLGNIWPNAKVRVDYTLGRKSSVKADAPSNRAFDWLIRALRADKLPETVEIWHSGRCGRCGRLLTVPASIEAGIGPECAMKLAA